MATRPLKALQGRVALITGSTSGIGLGIAQNLAKRGCNIILSGRRPEDEIQKYTTEINSDHGVEVKYLKSDLSKKAEVESLSDNVLQLHRSGIDILVNNDGFTHLSPVEEFPQEKWDSMLAVMLTAPFQLTKRLLPFMKAKGWGRIINVSSVQGHMASPNKAAYATAKHGIIGFTKVIALEAAGTGVTCNAISPGWVDTPIMQALVRTKAETQGISFDEAMKEHVGTFHPTGSVIKIDQIAEAVAFMCSDSASQMTGTSLIMDAGMTAQ